MFNNFQTISLHTLGVMFIPTNIRVCGVWGARAGIQVSRNELHTHIHLDYDRVEFLSYIKIK